MFYKLLMLMCFYGLINLTAAAETVYSQIDEKLLFDPDPLQKKKEAAGQVVIYDRVREQIINTALDNNFDRIEHMMFINTVIKTDTGELEAEDDCE